MWPPPSAALTPASAGRMRGPYGYISRAALIPAHIQSHPLILARSRGKKEREDVARGPTGPPPILVSCTCTPFRLTSFSLSLPLSLTPREFSLSFSSSRSRIPKLRVLEQSRRRSAGRLPVHLGILGRTRDRFFLVTRSLTHAFTHGANMKIMYAVMPTGGPVRSIDSGGASAARQAVKSTLKNLKRWCARLRHRTAARDLKYNQQNRPAGIKIPYDGDITMTMIVDQEESRNRANENLENELRESELRESLANNKHSETYGAFDDDDDCGCQPGDQDLTEDTRPARGR